MLSLRLRSPRIPALSRVLFLTPSPTWPEVSCLAPMWAPGLLRLPPLCSPHLPLHQSPHNYPTSVQEPAAHPLPTMVFGSLLISGAWWLPSPACTLGYSFTRNFVMFYLGTCGRKFDVHPTLSCSPFLPGLPRDSHPHCWLSIPRPRYPLGKTSNHSLPEPWYFRLVEDSPHSLRLQGLNFEWCYDTSTQARILYNPCSFHFSAWFFYSAYRIIDYGVFKKSKPLVSILEIAKMVSINRLSFYSQYF